MPYDLFMDDNQYGVIDEIIDEEEIDFSAIENSALQTALDQLRMQGSDNVQAYLDVIRQLASGLLFVDITGSHNVGEDNQSLRLTGRQLENLGEYVAGFTSQAQVALCYSSAESAQILVQYAFDILQIGASEHYAGVIINPGDEGGFVHISKAEINVYFDPQYRSLTEGLKAAIAQSHLMQDPRITFESFMRQERIWVTKGVPGEDVTFTVEFEGKDYFPVFTSLPELLYYCGSNHIGELAFVHDVQKQVESFTQGFFINPGGPSFKIPFSDLDYLRTYMNSPHV